MFDRKWNWPESLAEFRQPLPVPTHAKTMPAYGSVQTTVRKTFLNIP